MALIYKMMKKKNKKKTQQLFMVCVLHLLKPTDIIAMSKVMGIALKNHFKKVARQNAKKTSNRNKYLMNGFVEIGNVNVVYYRRTPTKFIETLSAITKWNVPLSVIIVTKIQHTSFRLLNPRLNAIFVYVC